MAKLAVKICISALLIWLLLQSFDTGGLIERLGNVSLYGPALAALMLFALSAAQAWRWTWVVRAFGESIGFWKSWEIVLIGLFFNQTLPSSVGGDAARIWRVYREGFELAHAIHSVVLDRLAALVALLLMVLLSLPVISELVGGGTAFWAVAGLAAVGLVGCVLLLYLPHLPGRLLPNRLRAAASRFSSDARSLFLRAGYALPVLLISACIHVFVALTVFVLARTMDIHVDALACIVLIPPVILISMIPVTIAGWGLREGAMVSALGFVGVPAQEAFLLSVVFGLVVMAVGMPGGVVWLATGRRKPRTVHLSDITAGLAKARNGRLG